MSPSGLSTILGVTIGLILFAGLMGTYEGTGTVNFMIQFGTRTEGLPKIGIRWGTNWEV